MTKTVEVILSPAIINALSVTRVVGLAAPPAGFINNILSISDRVDFGSAAYTGATTLIFETADGTNIFTDAASLPAVADKESPGLKAQATQGVMGTTEAFYITADGVGASGDSTIYSRITYEQIQIGA